MEELIPLIIISAIVSSIISSMKKKQTAADAQRRHAAASRRMAQPSLAEAVPLEFPADQVITPTVHPHIEPDCASHDVPGSLGVTSQEGKDPCHEEQLTHARTAEAAHTQEPALTFDWSGENLVKAFVMQEVLTRPCQRQAR